MTWALPGLLAAFSLVLAPACSDPAQDTACGGAACVVEPSRASLLEALEQHDDRLATWLRTASNDDGSVAFDAASLVDAVGESIGCPEERRSSYVVHSNPLAAKGIVAHCSDDAAAASEILTIFEPDPAGHDLHGDYPRMVAWDERHGSYRRYQFAPHPAGGLGVAVEPDFCTSCHRFGEVAWAPIMSEMTSPWARWNAEPGFESTLFDEAAVSESEGPTYAWVTQYLDSASRLEPIVRASIARITAAGLDRREGPATLAAADALLRPVFCDSRVNFVSESHGSGELDASAVLDVMIGRDLQRLGAESGWLFEEDLKLPATPDPDATVQLIPVRAELAVDTENALVARAVLTPLQSLRVRALDWATPVGSALRCDLYTSAFEAASAEDPAFEGQEDVDAVVAQLYSLAMRPVLDVLGSDTTMIVAIEDAAVLDELSPDSLTPFVLSVDALEAALLEYRKAHETQEGRRRLRAAVQDRGCLARTIDPTLPVVPAFDATACD